MAATCNAPDQCRQLALEAIAAGEYERAHDLAWRVVQTSPKRDRDPAALSLLARAQSLSGRGYDALVILQRLAEMGVVVDDADTSEDFRRARDYPQWAALRDTMSRLRKGSTAPAPTAPVGSAAPSAPAPVASASAPAGATADKPFAPLAPLAPVAPPAPRELRLPESLSAPVALAYDAVSARFVLANARSDILSVLSEASTNTTNLVSAGWSGGAEIRGIAIDRTRGDLWIAGNSGDQGVLYHLQLISGRFLQKVMAPKDSGASQFVAVAVGANDVYVLDAVGRRIFSLQPKAQTLRLFATLPTDIEPIGLTHAGVALYISHATGLLRVDAVSRAQRRVTTSGLDTSNLRSLAWHHGVLLGVRREGEPLIVRLRLNAQGTAVTAIDAIGAAAATAGTLSGDTYHYVATTDAGLALRSITLGK